MISDWEVHLPAGESENLTVVQPTGQGGSPGGLLETYWSQVHSGRRRNNRGMQPPPGVKAGRPKGEVHRASCTGTAGGRCPSVGCEYMLFLLAHE